MTRYVLVFGFLLVCLVGIGTFFWKQELKYQLPTPIPVNYKPVSLGQAVDLTSYFNTNQAYFLHFYNPDCPCSRFNSKNVKSLIRAHGDSVSMIIVVPDLESKKKAASEFENCTILVDTNEEIAKATGVYSTPQAVILDASHKVYYRGNYNKSRYCTAKATNFAELALVALLNHQPSPQFGLLAMQSYGCELGKSDESEIELF